MIEAGGKAPNILWRVVFNSITEFDSLKVVFFTSDHQTFYSLFKVRQYAMGCINHDIVIGLCSELLMRLSYYNHPGYGKKIGLTWGSNRGPSDCEPSTIPLDQSVCVWLWVRACVRACVRARVCTGQRSKTTG